MTNYRYGANDQDFNFDEVEDVLNYILEYSSPDDDLSVITIYRGELVTNKASAYVPNVYDYLSNNAYGHVGEYSDSWPDCDEDAINELQKMVEHAVDAWADKHNLQPNFGEIDNIVGVAYHLNGEWSEDVSADDYIYTGQTPPANVGWTC